MVILFLCELATGQQVEFMLPYGHQNRINSAAFSTDGSKVVTTSADNTAIVWNTKTGHVLAYINDLEGQPVSAAFSSDDKKVLLHLDIRDTVGIYTVSTPLAVYDLGKKSLSYFDRKQRSLRRLAFFNADANRILTVSDDSTVTIWDWKAGKQTNRYVHSGGGVTGAHFLNKQKRIIVSAGKHCFIWNLTDGKLVDTLKGHTGNIRFVDISPDESRAITTSLDNTRIIWDLQTGRKLSTIKDPEMPGRLIKFSPDNRHFITVAGDQAPVLWQAQAGRLVKNFSKMPEAFSWGAIRSARFTPDGEYVLCTYTGSILKIWEVRTGEIVKTFKWENAPVDSMQISPDCNYLLSSSTNRICVLWDIKTGAQLIPYWGNTNRARYASFNNDGTRIVTVSSKHANIWDASSYQILYSLRGHTGLISKAIFSPDGNWLITAASDSTIKVWSTWLQALLLNVNIGCDEVINFGFDSANDRLIAACINNRALEFGTFDPAKHDFGLLKEHKDVSIIKEISLSNGSQSIIDSATAPRNLAIYSPDGRQIVLPGRDGVGAIAYDKNSGNFLYALNDNSFILDADFSSDGKMILTASSAGTPKLWFVAGDNEFREPFMTLKGHKGSVNSAVFSKNGKWAVTASRDKTARIWDLRSGNTIQTLVGHTAEVLFATFDPAGKRVITSSLDATYKIWNAESGKLLLTLVQLDSADYLLRGANGYYHSTGRADKLVHYVTKDLQVISFDQLDVRLNRPDKVLESVESTDTALINAYRMAYYERMRNLNIDTASFTDSYNFPEADIINRDTIGINSDNQELRLSLKALDQQAPLSRYNVWINGVPVFGQNGVSLINKKSKEFSRTIKVKLSVGINRIEFSVTNVQGAESYRQPLFVTYQPQVTSVEKVYFVGIGINRFSNGVYPLEWCINDIKALAKKLKEKLGDRLVIVDTLFNQRVTTGNIRRLKPVLQAISVNDQLIVAYAGHGLFSLDSRYFLSGYDIDFEKPEEKGIPYTELENLMDSIPSRKKLLLLDACNSGEKIKLGSENSFALMKQLFVNVKKGTGAVVIAAAQGYQSALESNKRQHGVFTHSVLEAFENYGSLNVSALGKLVEARVVLLTDGRQQPTTRSQPLDADWKIW